MKIDLRRASQRISFLAAIPLLVLCPAARAASSSVPVNIRAAGTNAEGAPIYVLEWSAISNAIYRVQSRDGLSAGSPWKTEDVITPRQTGTATFTVGNDPPVVDVATPNPDARPTRFFRLEMPQPEIVRIEPAILSSSGGQIYVLGQCFASGFSVRVDGITMPTEFLDASQLRVTLPAIAPGQHDVQVVDGTGAVVATFALGVQSVSGLPLSSELPPESPPASPATKIVSESLLSNTRAERSLGEEFNTGNVRTDRCERVELAAGEFIATVTDLEVPGRGLDFVWTRTYRSRTGTNTAMGQGWDFSYNIHLGGDLGTTVVYDGNGRHAAFSVQQPITSPTKFAAPGYFREGLMLGSSLTFQLNFADGGNWLFGSLDAHNERSGKVVAIRDRNGNEMTFDYDPAGRLIRISDTLQRTYDIAYNADGYIESLTDFAGRMIRYAYYRQGETGGFPGDLKSVTSPIIIGTPNQNDFPQGKTTVYTYSSGFADERLNHNLLSIQDAKGQVWLRNIYATSVNPADVNFDRVVRQQIGNASETVNYFYTPQTPAAASGFAVTKTIVNDRVGNVGEWLFDSRNHCVMHREFAGRAASGQPTTETDNRPTGKLRAVAADFFETRYEWNADSLCTRVVYPKGNSTEFLYEREFDRNASPRTAGNLRVWRSRTGNVITLDDKEGTVQRFEHDPRFGSEGGTNFVTRFTDARGFATLRAYDNRGNLIHVQNPIPSVVEDFEYNQFGQVLAHVLPANGSGHRRRDELSYYSGEVEFAQRNGHLRSVTRDAGGPGAFGLVTTYDYDVAGNITSIIDPRGHDTLFVFNALNQIVRKSIYVAGSPDDFLVRYNTDYFYDANDNLTRVDVENRDESGVLQANVSLSTTRAFDILNCVTQKTEEVDAGLNVITQYEYDGNRNLTVARLPEAVNGNDAFNIVRSDYDERGLLFREWRAPGSALCSTNQWNYDANGNVSLQKDWDENDALSRVTQFSYDGFDRLTVTTDALGNTCTNRYDANRNLIAQRRDGTYADGETPEFRTRLAEEHSTFDSLNRLTRLQRLRFDPLVLDLGGDDISQYNHAADGQVVSVTDANGNTTRFAYDSASRLATVTDAASNTVTYGYDANGNVTSVTQVDRSDIPEPAQTFTVRYDYDNLDRLQRVTDNQTNTTRYAYDSRGNVVRITDARSHITRYTYDGLNRLVATSVDMNGDAATGGVDDIITRQSWDADSRLMSQTDDNTNTMVYLCDSLNRRIRTQYADGTVATQGHDRHDNLVFARDANGTGIFCAYDLLNRLTHKEILPGTGVASDTTEEDYQYDGLSRLVRAQDNDSVVTRAYDSLSHLRRETLNGVATASSYDAVGNRLSLTHPGGRVATWTYDALNRVKVVRDNNSGAVTELATLNYIGPDRVTRRDNGNGTRSRYFYDGALGVPNPTTDFGVRQLSRIRHALPGAVTVFDERSFTWDRNQNKIQRADLRPDGSGVKHDYTYDAANRLVLTQVNDVGGLLRQSPYPLDGAGNRLPQLAGAPPWTMDATTPEPADYQMNQYSSTDFDIRGYDADGNTLATVLTLPWVWLPSRIMSYDYRNQLVGVLEPFTGAQKTYTYDALGRRIRTTVDAANGEPPVTTLFFYDGENVIEERQDDAVLANYYWLPEAGGEVLALFRGGHRYTYHHDDLGNVMALTDENGGLAEHYEYLDYGEPQFFDSDGNSWLISVVGNPYLFQSMRYDSESGFYRCGGRRLDPQAGRFSTRDPAGIWSDPRGLGNGFTFAGNNPWSERGAELIFNPKEYSVEKLTVRGWDPQKKQKMWLPANFRIPLGGIDQRTVNSTTARSSVQDFEKNTEKVGGGFGLTSQSGGSPRRRSGTL